MKNRSSNVGIGFLPEDLLSEIVTHAASNSITDFMNAKLSCKAFLGASNNDYVFKHVSLEKHYFIPYLKKDRIFFKRCERAKNAEALYRRGMINFVSRRKPESGLRYLKKAAEKGHEEAKYVYGIILICSGGEQRKQGLGVVSSLNLTSCSRTRSKIAGFRSKIKESVCRMWVSASLAEPEEYFVNNNAEQVCCRCDDRNITPPIPDLAWDAQNSLYQNLHCCRESCFWDREAILFCDMLMTYQHVI